MKILRFSAGKSIKFGVLEGNKVNTLSGEPFKHIKTTDIRYSLDDIKILAPCVPSKIVAVGLNYYKHARECNMAIPELPLLFLKPSTAVIGPEDNIVHPKASTRVDYEAELGIVIGKTASKVPLEKALDYVLGYTCVNDVTARDLQEKDGQWTRAKGFDTFAPIGPWIETELDPANTPVEAWVNGERRQQGNTSDLIHPVPRLVSFISGIMTLLPGDIIATGTPVGISSVHPGDVVEIRIEPVGILRNRITGEI